MTPKCYKEVEAANGKVYSYFKILTMTIIFSENKWNLFVSDLSFSNLLGV